MLCVLCFGILRFLCGGAQRGGGFCVLDDRNRRERHRAEREGVLSMDDPHAERVGGKQREGQDAALLFGLTRRTPAKKI